MAKSGGIWTEKELDILRKYYSAEGSAVCKRLKGRTEKSCAKKAARLNLAPPKIWTEEEEEILRQYYPTEGKRVLARLPGKSLKSTLAKAARLGIRSERGQFWTEEEIDILRLRYPTEGSECFELIPRHTADGIATMVRRLGIKTIAKNKAIEWTPELDEKLTNLFGTVPDYELAEKFGTTVHCLRKRVSDLEILRQKKLLLDIERPEKLLFARRCHTCGKPTDGSYWCERCREKRLRAAGWTPECDGGLDE